MFDHFMDARKFRVKNLVQVLCFRKLRWRKCDYTFGGNYWEVLFEEIEDITKFLKQLHVLMEIVFINLLKVDYCLLRFHEFISESTHFSNRFHKHLQPSQHLLVQIKQWNTKTICEPCSKLLIKRQEPYHWCGTADFIVNFE